MSDDDKSDICQFFIKIYFILSIQYVYKISRKMEKIQYFQLVKTACYSNK